MTEQNNTVSLIVDGLNYQGWKSVSISAGIERLVRDFSLAITWKWPGQTIKRPPQQGSKCQVKIGNELVLTGYVFATPISYDGTTVTLSVSGRSLTADLVDCSAIMSGSKKGQWSNQTLFQIINDLIDPYGLTVLKEVDNDQRLIDHTIEPGETVFESINRLLSIYREFATDNGKGNVVICKIGSAGRASTDLVVGKNILSGSAEFDFSNCFSEYQILNQSSGSNIKSTADDPRIERKRVLIIQQNGVLTKDKADARANWEASSRIGKALSATYTVNGWRQPTGQLWIPNLVVRVKDEVMNFDRDMLITEVTYSLDDRGMITTLIVMPPEGAEPIPDKPKKKIKVKGADGFEYLIPADYKDKD